MGGEMLANAHESSWHCGCVLKWCRSFRSSLIQGTRFGEGLANGVVYEHPTDVHFRRRHGRAQSRVGAGQRPEPTRQRATAWRRSRHGQLAGAAAVGAAGAPERTALVGESSVLGCPVGAAGAPERTALVGESSVLGCPVGAADGPERTALVGEPSVLGCPVGASRLREPAESAVSAARGASFLRPALVPVALVPLSLIHI